MFSDFYYLMKAEVLEAEAVDAAATNLWTWLPSNHGARMLNSEYYAEFQPSTEVILSEAAMEILRLRRKLVAAGVLDTEFGDEVFDFRLTPEEAQEVCWCGYSRAVHVGPDFTQCGEGGEFKKDEGA